MVEVVEKHNQRKGVNSMASKNKNPYRAGSAYANIFDFIRSKQVVTRSDLLKQGFSVSDVTVVLSPRAEGSSTRDGDCRGNLSAQGQVYFLEKLAKKQGEDQRFRLRYRKTELEKRVRPPKVEKASKKSESAKASKKTVEKAVEKTATEA